MRAAMLHGPGDLRVEEVAEPEGEVLVTVEAATACATDLKALRHGHLILGPYPARFGHETAGVRDDTGERVLVGDSVPCGACDACRAGLTQLCADMTWVLGGFAERIAAPAAALHAVPDGPRRRRAPRWPSRSRRPCTPSRAPATSAPTSAILGGGTMGLMLARLLVLEGRDVTLCDRHPQRRAQAEALGARAVAQLGRHELVMEAVGRPESWRAAIEAARPGGDGRARRRLPVGLRRDAAVGAAALRRARRPRRLSPHARPRSTARSRCWRAATSTGARFAGETIGLDELADALVRPSAGEARKLVVDPHAGKWSVS